MSKFRLGVVWDAHSRIVHWITKREGDSIWKDEEGMMVLSRSTTE
jgi:hypothetical protein